MFANNGRDGRKGWVVGDNEGNAFVLFSVEVSWGVSACVRAYRNIGKRNISFPTVKSALLLLFDISTYS